MKNIRKKSKPFLVGLCIGSLLVAAIFVGWQRHCGRQNLIELTSAQAKHFSAILGTCVAFNDKVDAYKTLGSLMYLRSVAFAGVYDKQDNLFSAYFRRDIPQRNIKATENPKTGWVFSDGYLKVSEPIILGDEVVGKICIWAEP